LLLLHTSDTHLGASRPRLRDREVDYYDVFDEVVDIAIRERVDAVIHCGDLFNDHRPTPQTYYYAFKSLKRLKDSGIEFLVIAGQHDQPKVASLSPIKVLDEVGLVKSLAVRHGDVESHTINLRSGALGIVAIPYFDPPLAQDVLRRVRPPSTSRRVLMAHMLLKELNIPNAHTSLSELPISNFNYVALGDYHLRYEVNVHGVPVVYPGSTEALDVLEYSDDRFVALVDLSGGEALVSWVKLSRFRRWLVLNISSYSELIKYLGSALNKQFSKAPIVYVRMTEKVRQATDIRSINDYLSRLRDEGKILTYIIRAPEGPEEVAEGGGGEEYVPTLESVVHNLIKDPQVAQLVLNIVKGSDNVEFVKLLITDLISNESLINKLEKLVGRG